MSRRNPPEAIAGWLGERGSVAVIPRHEDPFFTFQFAGDRLIPRGASGSAGAGLLGNPATLALVHLLTTTVVGEGGWVDLAQAVVRPDR
jgi:hypothetical protein